MNKVKRKIVTGTITAVCAFGGIAAASVIGEKAENGAVPASVTSYENQKPVIILDAGHGGFDLN